jgi:uncharacterized membrane protein YcaP (DUF421 family)
MLGLDVFFSCVKRSFPAIEKVIDGAPLILLDNKGLRDEAIEKERVDKEDILNAARSLRGLANMEQIEYAVLEQTGEITIVPKPA